RADRRRRAAGAGCRAPGRGAARARYRGRRQRCGGGRVSGPRMAVKALIIRDRQVLMNRYVHPAGHEMFELPGGGQEHGEDQPSALLRECREGIGALVEVHQVACLFELMADRSIRDGAPIRPFHQVNVAYWCGLAEGEEPGEGTEPDRLQAGTAWLPL